MGRLALSSPRSKQDLLLSGLTRSSFGARVRGDLGPSGGGTAPTQITEEAPNAALARTRWVSSTEWLCCASGCAHGSAICFPETGERVAYWVGVRLFICSTLVDSVVFDHI